MKQPKVTFFMMAYNSEKYIAKAIESILNQTEQNIVLCIRNNGSTDATGAIIRGYAEKDSRIYFVENKTNGITEDGIKTFQEGWWPYTEETAGEYFSIIDSDDWLAPNYTEVLYEAGKKQDADMVIGGCYFVDEKSGKITGERKTPKLEVSEMGEVGPYFHLLYDSLRPWWGKLYKREFFIKHYKEAWTPVAPLTVVIDTIAVLHYFRRCQKLVSIDQPLYYFLSRVNATYSSKPMDFARILEANLLYEQGMKVLRHFHMAGEENKQFLLHVHLGYLIEAMTGLKMNATLAAAPVHIKLGRLADVLNDHVVKLYLEQRFEGIFRLVESYIIDFMQEENVIDWLWSSYLARLYRFRSNLEINPTSVLLFPVLISCLCDAENKNYVGQSYVTNEIYWEHRELSNGERWFLNVDEIRQRYYFDHPQELLEEMNKLDRIENVIEKEQQLMQLIQSEDYDHAWDVIEEVSQICPFNLTAMYCRIQVAIAMEEWDLAQLLAATAKVLWPREKSIQILYWNLQEQR